MDSPKDETGASDAFIGAYAVEILRQMGRGSVDDEGLELSAFGSSSCSLNIPAALEFATKAGGFVVGKLGSAPVMPWRDELLSSGLSWLTITPSPIRHA